MAAFSGAEPLVGDIVALRTFRIDESGLLLPLYSAPAWYDGTNTAGCVPPTGDGPAAAHRVPGAHCECGFYAYGSEHAIAQHRQSRYVLAAVSCWGAVVAGTQGLRAEHARIDALWLARQVPPAVRHRVASRYPSARIYGDRAAMLAEHPPTQLPCYAPAPPRHLGRWAAALLAAVTIVALGVVPIGVLRATAPLWALWLLATATLGAGALWLLLGPRGTGHRAAGVVVAEVFAWVVSPAVGMAGWLLRVPVLRALLVAGFGYLRTLRPGYFPVEHAPRERPFCGVRV